MCIQYNQARSWVRDLVGYCVLIFLPKLPRKWWLARHPRSQLAIGEIFWRSPLKKNCLQNTNITKTFCVFIFFLETSHPTFHSPCLNIVWNTSTFLLSEPFDTTKNAPQKKPRNIIIVNSAINACGKGEEWLNSLALLHGHFFGNFLGPLKFSLIHRIHVSGSFVCPGV